LITGNNLHYFEVSEKCGVQEVTERCDILSLKNPSLADRIRGLH